jgi:hypothetical protein
MPIEQLPFIDEHTTTISAGVDDVWTALLDFLDGPFFRTGFRVTAVVPGSELVLEGRHPFSIYALTFRLESIGSGQSRLRAESRAAFPGARGRLYRLLVIGSRGHVGAVRHMLRRIRRRSEATTRR